MEPHSDSDLVELHPDHPGFNDEGYRARRNAIAKIAYEYRGGPVPHAPYSPEEHRVWAEAWSHLRPLHEAHACRECVELSAQLALPHDRIPQIEELNPRLTAATGFRMHPVAGLVTGQVFLGNLGRRIFLSTQYVRHAATPLYTPEPDVIHELVGHAATLMNPELAELNRRIGLAAEGADDQLSRELERLYWYTLEFGAAEQDGQVKAYGAGLLSSYGEIQRFAKEAKLEAFDAEKMAHTPYDPTDYQPVIFVADSFHHALEGVTEWVDKRVPRRASRASAAG
jgi:phenylalanine-4-hydroxylase